MISGSLPSEIKKALAEGRLKEANLLLDSPYYLKGVVVEGSHIGRTIGVPTANIKLDEDSPLLLAYGVYAVNVDLKGRIYNGMANIGIRPTMKDHHLTIEVNIFDLDEDLYGEFLKIYFIDRIREERKFSGLEEMKEHIQHDRIRALEILSSRNKSDSDTK